jgi:DNA-binding GntR family transcriptional regulator
MISYESISDKIYGAIYEQICNQTLPLGSRLKEEQVARDLGVSRTPLREALNRLIKDGLLEMEPRKGVRVKNFTVEDVVEVYDIRKVLEGLAAGLAVPKLDPQVLKDLQRAFESKDTSVLLRADTELHDLIVRHCGNARLIDMLDNLHNLIQVFRISGYGSPTRSEQATRDHLKIIQACLDRDAVQAEFLVREHIENTKKLILQNFKTQGRG